MFMRAFRLCAVLALISISFAARALEDPIILDSGKISGVAPDGAAGVRVYKGVPFAAPPVADLRWKAPEPPAKWEGVRACSEFAAACPQPDTLSRTFGIKLGPVSEDCLYLNVWTAAEKAGEKRPVMVWIHGGSFYAGTGASYSGAALARQGAVVVTINYRLGPFGFFSHPQLSKESGRDASGNYGLLDQIEALKWVKRNIAAFGGDPDCVTIFGESAGAASVSALLVTPESKGLFHRAIMQSGSFFGQPGHLRERWHATEPAEKQGERLAKEMGLAESADPVAEMRKKTAEEILAVAKPALRAGGGGNRFLPIVDGAVVPDDPNAIFAAGKQHAVPVIAGSNADEGTIFLSLFNANTVPAYEMIVRALFRENAPEALRFYPVANETEVPNAVNKLASHSTFTAGARASVRAQEKAGQKAFLYYFTRVSPGAVGQKLGAFHAAEIPYVLGDLEMFKDGMGIERDATDEKLSKAMSAYWINFARTGDPNGESLPEWPAYAAATDRHIEFGDEIKTGEALLREQMDFFERVNERRAALKRGALGSE